MSFLFGGKKPSPDEMVKKWRRQMRSEQRVIERDIKRLEREEEKVKMEVRAAAQRGDIDIAKMLAKELVNSKKGKERMYIAKTHLNSVSMQLQEQLSMMRVTKCMAKSA